MHCFFQYFSIIYIVNYEINYSILFYSISDYIIITLLLLFYTIILWHYY